MVFSPGNIENDSILRALRAIIAAKPHYDRELVTSDLQRAWFPNTDDDDDDNTSPRLFELDLKVRVMQIGITAFKPRLDSGLIGPKTNSWRCANMELGARVLARGGRTSSPAPTGCL